MIYLHNFTNQNEKLHTIINKEEIKEWTYIIAIGYGGGGVFEEFCGKFKYCDKAENNIGMFSRFHNPDEWECEVQGDKIINDPWIIIEDADKIIINSMSETIWADFIKYDEDEETRFINKNVLKQLSVNGTYLSDDWDADIVDWVSNKFWGLSLTFDW
jgi:hypothetical protein|tara:strand:- start:930 stop:1403 length:474 start_codon:yes stop_codon:yes gene_type:complete